MLRILLAALVFSLTTAAVAEDFNPAAKKELERLAGDWRIVSVMRDGKEEEIPADLKNMKIDGNKMLVGEKRDRDIGLRITMLEPSTKPQLIDVTHPETKKTLEGIYEITDERWKMCLNAEGLSERPATFDGGSAKFILVVLERVK